MIEQIVVESKPLLRESKSQAATLSAARVEWRLSAAWLPFAALFGAFCTLAVVSVALSGPTGWWLGAQSLVPPASIRRQVPAVLICLDRLAGS